MAICCKRRRAAELNNTMELMNNSSTLENGPRPKSLRAEPKIPTWLCVLAVIAYISCFACFLSLYHAWNFVDSFYFAFSVLGTIGLPETRVDEAGTGSSETGLHVAMCTFYILAGLAILAMAGILVREDRGWSATPFIKDGEPFEGGFSNKMPNDQTSSWVYNSR